MRVFVTGASGFVGSAVVADLVAAGHAVTGLARSEASAAAIAAAGAQVHRGSVEDMESLRSGAAAADGVIHTAFIHDFSRFKESCEIDRRAVETLASELEGTGRALVVTSATGVLAPHRTSTEEDAAPVESPNPRIATEQAVEAAAGRGTYVSVVRLPPSVHGEGDHGFVPMLVDTARRKGMSAYVGDGQNRWAGVHRADAAAVYRLALEKGAAFARYHAVAETSVPFRKIAEAIGRGLKLPVRGLAHEEAADHFGWPAHFAALDCPTSGDRTRAALGWEPAGPDLIADIEQAGYFGP